MIDSLHIMKSAGLVAASSAATVDGAAKIADVGAGLVEGQLVIDCTAIETDTGSELYTIELEGSSSATFASDYDVLASCCLGATAVKPGDVLGAVGRYRVPFKNEKAGTVYPYLRVYTTCAGTIATGINYSAYLAKA